MKLTPYEQLLYNLRVRYQKSTVVDWGASIGLGNLLDMSAAAAIALCEHDFHARGYKPYIVTARRVVCDILFDLKLSDHIDETHSLPEEMATGICLRVLRAYHEKYPYERHCREEEVRDIAALGILPLIQERKLADVLKGEDV